jgi:competence protein ComEA
MTDLWESVSAWVLGRAYRHAWKVAIALAVCILTAAVWLFWPRSAEPVMAGNLSTAEIDSAQQRWVIVYVSGAVENPGLYRLEANLRVVDAIIAAGGTLAGADQSCLPNLAAHLKDGKQIVVPFAGRCAQGRNKRVDVNSAGRDQLMGVPGIDGDLADAIIAYREANGGFSRLSELKSGLGIDGMLFKKLQKLLTVY